MTEKVCDETIHPISTLNETEGINKAKYEMYSNGLSNLLPILLSCFDMDSPRTLSKSFKSFQTNLNFSN